MKSINDYRAELEQIDLEMVDLFEKRMKIVEAIAVWKKENHFPVFDALREEELFNRNSALLKNKDLLCYYRSFFQGIMDASKAYQEQLND